MSLATTPDAPSSIGRPTKVNSQPIEVESPERVNISSIGVGGSAVNASPVSTSPDSNADGTMPSSVLGGGGKHAGSSEQRQAQLARSKNARVVIFADWRGWSGICS